MVTSNETQNKKTTVEVNPDASEKPALANQPKTSSVTTKQNPRFLLAMVAAVALFSFLMALYALKLHTNLKDVANAEAEQFAMQLDSLKRQQLDTDHHKKAMESLTEKQTQLQDQVNILQKDLQMAIQQRAYQKEDWILLKARYYLELAQINAHWGEDQQTTIAMLQGADSLLMTIPSQHLFPVRQAIAREITQLQALPTIDIAGLLSQLDAAANLVFQLPLKQLMSSDASSEVHETKQLKAWRQHLKETMQSLEGLVVIRRHDENIQPLLSPIHEAMLRESIRMNLEEAQWAVLQKNPRVYQFALSQAIKNTKRGFNENAPSTQALLAQLLNLKQKKLLFLRTSINQSLPLLNQVIEQKKPTAVNSEVKEGDHSQ
jgi:uroporphyrin-3 C-methyltransferase